MKRLASVAVLGLLTAALVGCEAGARIGEPEEDRAVRAGETYERRETTVYPAEREPTRTETEIEIQRTE